MKKRVTGLGGVFFKCQDPGKMKAWYGTHLGIEAGEYGGQFEWRKDEAPHERAVTAWNTFPEDTSYFDPSPKSFMFNYRVEDLEGLLVELEKEGVTIVGGPDVYSYGKFAWIMDPEGNKIELWEPIDAPLTEGE